MRFNNRAMALAGIPDLPEEAFKHNGDHKIKPQGGGGGGNNTTTGTTYTSNIPEYLRPYVEDMMGATEKEIYKYDASGNRTGFKPYQSYAQYDQARGGTGESVAGFTPLQVQSMQNMQNYRLPNQTQYGSRMAGMAGLGSMQAGNQYAQQATNPYAMQAYMSPYMQGAVAPELREAARQSAIQGQANQAQAVQQGAFGGSRSAIVEAERQRNLAQQQADIYGKGMQNAYQNAQQAQQFGSTLGLQGYGQALQGAQTLGSLGQAQYGQEMGLMGQQQAIGKLQQEYEQNRLNQIIQDYATSQQYPLMQLGVLNAMTRGLPMQSSSSQMYQAQPSMASQIAGGLGTTAQLYNTFNQATKGSKEGGIIKMAAGGIATGVPPAKLPSMLEKLSDDQLGKKDQDKETDPATKQMVDAEQVRRGTLRGGIKTMAAGGAIAFNGAERSDVEDKEKDKEKTEEEKRNKGILSALEKSPTTPAEGTNPIPPIAPEVDPYTGLDTYPDLKGSVADEARKGIATEKPAVGPTREDMYAAQEKLLKDQANAEKLKSERTVNQVIAAQDAERKAAGFVDPAIAEGKALDERKARIAGDAQELAKDRLTQFLIDWGKTPGPALNGYINAGGKLIEANIEDKKLRKKLLDELDDARLGVNRGVYERRLGNEKEARAEIAKAGEQYYAINEKILQHKEKVYLKQLDLENKLAQMELKGEIALLKSSQNKAAIVQQAEIKAKALVEKYVREIANGTMTVAQIEDMALNEVLARQPQVTAAQTAVVPQLQNAATNEAGLTIQQANAESTRLQAEIRRSDEVNKQVMNKLLLDKTVRAQMADAEKADAAAKIKSTDPNSAVAKLQARVKQEVEAGMTTPSPVGTARPATSTPAPAKTKGKDAAPAETKIAVPDGAPAGSTIGKKTDKGYEVINNGKLIGYAR